jgi:hypothetical protein
MPKPWGSVRVPFPGTSTSVITKFIPSGTVHAVGPERPLVCDTRAQTGTRPIGSCGTFVSQLNSTFCAVVLLTSTVATGLDGVFVTCTRLCRRSIQDQVLTQS